MTPARNAMNASRTLAKHEPYTKRTHFAQRIIAAIDAGGTLSELMAKLAKSTPRPLWAWAKYDMHTIASGLPVECVRGISDDYQCTHLAFLQGLRRFGRKHDVVFRAEPLREGTEQVGWTVQFFWDLHRSFGHAVPDSFRYPDASDPELLAKCSPYVRPVYGAIPPDRRLAVTLE